MGMADIAEVIWNRHLRFNPRNPAWPDRDRFVLSNGHGSMLLYGLLHLTGFDLPMGEIDRFRQLHSKTPGHPERGLTPGVETTTGPLGQGFANAVGFALAERALAAEFNRPGIEVVDHRTYVFMGDGCMMEGVSHEAASLAGTLGLGKLLAIYDDNGISIDSEKSTMEHWFTDDTPKRFEAYGWNVIRAVDGHDFEAIEQAVRAAQAVSDRPSLLCCKTIIGKGAPNKANTGAAHGAALGRRKSQRHEQPWAGNMGRSRFQQTFTPAGMQRRAASSWRQTGKRSSRATPSSIQSWPPSSDVGWKASCQQAGERIPTLSSQR